MLINVWECNIEPDVWFNGEKIEGITKFYDKWLGMDTYDAPVTFKEGKNSLIVRVKAEKNSFSAKVIFSFKGKTIE